eukprot:TRINITY_DN27612_c0_g1_i1.p1 TRINITY_DN27612_c0_g1~~TRINITY_DN27612_c0_g1_i1.p1  ORF type:complete len:965 (-),score=263.67 TRINITY_DN27612_c0_g1_i1:72-2966(-)
MTAVPRCWLFVALAALLASQWAAAVEVEVDLPHRRHHRSKGHQHRHLRHRSSQPIAAQDTPLADPEEKEADALVHEAEEALGELPQAAPEASLQASVVVPTTSQVVSTTLAKAPKAAPQGGAVHAAVQAAIAAVAGPEAAAAHNASVAMANSASTEDKNSTRGGEATDGSDVATNADHPVVELAADKVNDEKQKKATQKNEQKPSRKSDQEVEEMSNDELARQADEELGKADKAKDTENSDQPDSDKPDSDKEDKEDKKDEKKDKGSKKEDDRDAESEEDRKDEEKEDSEKSNKKDKDDDSKSDDTPRRNRRQARHPGQLPDLDEEYKQILRESAAARTEMHDVEKMEDVIAFETKSRGLAEMLGSMKMDVYLLNERVESLEDEMKEGVRLKPEDPEAQSVYPVSTGIRCILLLAVVYLVIHMALAVCRAEVKYLGLADRTKGIDALKAACETVFYAPMLCVLFIAVQMRVWHVTAGKGAAQDWVQVAMQACCWAILMQTLVVLVVPALTGQVISLTRGNSMNLYQKLDGNALVSCVYLVRYLALVALYGGLAIVCRQAMIMDGRSLRLDPPDYWDNPATGTVEYAPPLSAALTCTIYLTVLFFGVHFCHSVACSIREASKQGGESEEYQRALHTSARMAKMLRHCADAVNTAPVVGLLFITCRMRVLQADPTDDGRGTPPKWVENGFYLGLAAVAFHVVGAAAQQGAAIYDKDKPRKAAEAAAAEAAEDQSVTGSDTDVSPRLLGSRQRTASLGATFSFPAAEEPAVHATPAEKACVMARCLAVILIYAASMTVALGIMRTPPLAPAVKCALCLATIYLDLYLVMFLAQGAGELLQQKALLSIATELRSLDAWMRIAPMLALLLLGTRLRSMELGGRRGSPQCWAQDAMYWATAAWCVHAAMVLACEAAASRLSKGLKILLEVSKALAALVLMAAVALIVMSVLAVRPESAACEARGFEVRTF